jgi:hypothetical protein
VLIIVLVFLIVRCFRAKKGDPDDPSDGYGYRDRVRV